MTSTLLRNYFLINVSLFILLIFSSKFFSNISFYFLFLLLFSFLLKSLKEINIFSKKLYDIFFIIFFLKIILLFIVFWIGESLGLERGNIPGSDSMTYYYSLFIVKKIFLSIKTLGLVLSLSALMDGGYILYLIFISLFVENITLVQIGIINIFLTSFLFIFVYRILTILEVSKNIILVMCILILIDLKFLVLSFFNLEETLVMFLITFGFYDFLKNRSNYSLIFVVRFLFTIFLIFILKNNLALILILLLFGFITFDKFKSKINLKTLIFITLSSLPIIYLIFYFLFYESYVSLLYSRTMPSTSSIGATIHDLELFQNPFNIFIQLFAAIIGIFPIYKIYTPFMEMEKLCVIWFHILLISSAFGVKDMISKKKFNIDHFFLLTILFGLLLIFAVAAGGGLAFIRYSIFIHIPLIYFSANYLHTQVFKKIIYMLVVLLFTNLALLGIYFPIKSIYF